MAIVYNAVIKVNSGKDMKFLSFYFCNSYFVYYLIQYILFHKFDIFSIVLQGKNNQKNSCATDARDSLRPPTLVVIG